MDNKIFSIGQIVIVRNQEFGRVLQVDVDRNNNTIYQVQIPNDPHKRWYLGYQLELAHKVQL